MFRFIKIISVALFLFCLVAAQVKAEEVLGWTDCLKEAKENNPGLISAAEKLKQLRADKAITQSSGLPQISSSLTGSKTETGGSAETNTYAYSLTGKQLLFDGSKTSNDVKAASETLRAQEYNYAVTSSNLRLSLRTAFSELLKAQELISITETIASRRKQNLELVKLRYEAGREHKGSLLTAQADLAQAEFEIAQAKRDLCLAQRQLTAELGRNKFSPVKVKGDFQIAESNRDKPDFEYLADNTIFLKELIAKKEAARFGLKSAKADFFPAVYLNTSYGETASSWPPNTESWSAGLSLSLPIFEGGSRIAKLSKAEAELNQAQADQQSGRDSVILTLEQTWVELQDSIDELSVQNKYLRAAEERAKIANSQYSTGLISFDDWVIIEDSLVSRKKSFLNAQANILLAEAYWIQAKGGILEHEE
jgi:outer membrane protein TolC